MTLNNPCLIMLYDLTAPAVMPSMNRRCSSTNTATTGRTMMTAAAEHLLPIGRVLTAQIIGTRQWP